MASSLRPTMRRLLLLLATATSIHCQVRTEGLAVRLDDASATTSPDSSTTTADGAAPSTGGQGAGGQGGAGGAIDGSSTEPVASTGGALGIDALTSPTGGTLGSGGANGGVPGTGGRLGPSGLGGLALDARGSLLDGPTVEVTAVPDAPSIPPDLAAAGPDTNLGLDGEPSPDLGSDQAPDLASSSDVVGPDVQADAELPLVWNDEFDGAARTAPDDSKWGYATWGPFGGVNNEKQQYTTSLDNVFLDGEGHVVIRALKAPQQGAQYTSGRIQTKGKFQFKTGRLEVRAKLPAGIGSFPGIIALGVQGGWPQCGELALVEQYGQDKSWFYSSAYADTTPESGDKRNVRYDFPNSTTASTDFHVYTLDWYSDHLVFQVDGDEIMQTSFGKASPFETTPEYIVLDVAVGGNMGGAVDPEAFPMDMLVDYVRVYGF